MTVAELMERLKDCQPNDEIVVACDKSQECFKITFVSVELMVERVNKEERGMGRNYSGPKRTVVAINANLKY